MTSHQVVSYCKKILRSSGRPKIGHFGTLDPFACGVLLIGINGAQRLNDYIHDYLPKTYLAVGKLGIYSDTGDMTGEIIQRDETNYGPEVIASFSPEFIEQQLQEKFLGNYFQAPHKYSAAKHEGKKLYQWAREGVEIVKEKKQRQIYKIEVVKFSYPYLSIRFEVSSGTYIRTLFSECAQYLGTLGTLVSLVREQVGAEHMNSSLKKGKWELNSFNASFISPWEILKFGNIVFEAKEARLYSNGVRLKEDRANLINKESLSSKENIYWVKDMNDNYLGMAQILDGEIISRINFN